MCLLFNDLYNVFDFSEFDSIFFVFDDIRKLAVGHTVMPAISGDFYKISVANGMLLRIFKFTTSCSSMHS